MRPVVTALARNARLSSRSMSTQLTAEQMYKLTHRERCIANKIDMDSLPKPYGNWQTEYAARQAKLNIHLAVSAIACFVTTYVVFTRGLVIKPDLKKPVNVAEVFEQRLAEAGGADE